MREKPSLSRAAIAPTATVEARDETGAARAVAVGGERPLTIYVDREELITLMTLGQEPEHLVVGYLRNQRLVESPSQIESVQVDWEVFAAAVQTRAGRGIDGEAVRRRVVTSGCGQGTMFGGLLEEIEESEIPRAAPLRESALFDLLAQVRVRDTIYKAAGAVHGCALCRLDGERAEIEMFIEDVGRHNAVDAIAGRMWLEEIDAANKAFYTTGRLTSEMVVKCAQMKIPALVSRSGVTQMGLEIARKTGLTMLGRALNRRYLLFSGGEGFARE